MKPLEIVVDGHQAGPRGISAQEIEHRLIAAMPDAQVKIYDLTGDGSHYQLEVASQSFAGKGRIEQHRFVNGLFKDVLGGALHALALTTKPL